MTVSRRRVYVVEDAISAVAARAEAAVPYETGGIITGVATDASVWITAFVEIEVSERHLARFVVPAGSTHRLIDRLRTTDDRIGYLGDWHTHPADIGPSGRDFATLADLVVGSLGHGRMIGLLRWTSRGWEVGLWGVSRLRRPERLSYELTGPLPIE